MSYTEYDPDEPVRLPALMGAQVNAYWNDYLEYWEVSDHLAESQLTPQQRDVHKQLDRIGEALRKSLNTLAPDATSDEMVRELWELFEIPEHARPDTASAFQALHTQPLVRDCVSIALAFEVADTLLPVAHARAAELVGLLSDRHLSERALAYLRRATRLHLWGFDSECAILCRSVLEAALTSRLTQEIKLDEPPPPLEKLIALAGERGLFPGYATARNRRGWRAVPRTPLADAESLRRAGNHLIHDVPSLGAHNDGIGNSLDALKILISLLNRMFPQRASA